MKVKVIPKRPISGILPKNKWIDSEMELELNKNEIARCMQFGTVYDMNGNIIDDKYLHTIDLVINKQSNFTPNISRLTSPIIKDEPIVIISEDKADSQKQLSDKDNITEEILLTEFEVISNKKENEYNILELQFNSTQKLENVYGLFNIISGSRPVIEYKNGENWIKFNNKFNNFSFLEDGTKFVFRFIPKNESPITYRITIKKGNNIITQFEQKINFEEL